MASVNRNLHNIGSILITGCAGFIGSHVLDAVLVACPNTRVIGLDFLAYCANVHNLQEAKTHSNFTFIEGSIDSSDLLRHILREYDIRFVLHFAAETHVDNSFGNSLKFTKTNVLGTHCLLEACREYGAVELFVHVSTDEVYGENPEGHEQKPFDASSALNPTNPYAATKAAAEFLVKAYGHSYKLPWIITRGNNVYGPRQFPEKVIPKFLNRITRGQNLPVHGTGSQLRSFLYVTDVCEAFVRILAKGKLYTVYNIGTHEEISMLSLAQEILSQFGRGQSVYHVEDRKFNDRRYWITNHVLSDLGWSPKVPFREGLRLTWDWYAQHVTYWPNVDLALAAHPKQ